MSDTPAQEPTMEEILASIRRIISEDDAPAAKTEEDPLPIPPPLEDEPLAAAPEDDVLELTERVDQPVETLGDLDVYTPSAPEPAYEPEPEPEPVYEAPPAPPPVFEAPPPTPVFEPGEGLVGAVAASAAASAFGKLSSGLLMPKEGRTLEDVVRELLYPMLKDWLDTNLPAIVEAKVEEEVARIARGGRVG